MSLFNAYRTLLGRREAAWLAISAAATRLPTSLLNLGFLTTVQEWNGSYSQAGLVWTVFAVAFAVGVPVTGHIADRKGAWPVLAGCLICYVPTLILVLIALLARAPLALLFPAVAVLGLCTPPAAPLIRGSWPEVVPPYQLRSAFALDAVITEAALIGGPLIVSALIAFATPVAAVALGGLFMVGGSSLLLAAPSVKKRKIGKDSGRERHRPMRPLGQRGLRVLFLIVVFDILGYGCMIVGITATVTHDHARSALGILLSVFSIGVVTGGLLYGGRRWPGSPRAQLSLLYATSALILAATSLHISFVSLGALLVGAGLIGGPRDALLQLLIGDRASPEYRTEAFAWLTTTMWVSYGLGTALGGQLASLSGGNGNLALLAAALGGGCAATCALRVRTVPATGTAADTHPAGAVSLPSASRTEGE